MSEMLELPNTLVVVALRAESAGVFEAAGIPVLYCGVGKVNAAIALARPSHRHPGGMPRVRAAGHGRARFGICIGGDAV